MAASISRGIARQKRHDRLRLRVAGDPERPRLAVFRSLNHIYAQVIDDSTGRTLAAASSLEPDLRSSTGTKSGEAAVVGRLVAERARAAGVGPVARRSIPPPPTRAGTPAPSAVRTATTSGAAPR